MKAVRVPRAIRASLAGLGIGYGACIVAVLWLKASSGDAEALWNLLSPLRVATWFVTSAHAVPLVVRSAAGVTAPEAAGSVGRLSELLGGGEDVVFSFSVVLVSISILTIVGIAVALLVRWSNPSSPRDVLRTVTLAAGVHGIVLALAARWSSVDLVFEGTLAPDLGLGAATGRVGLGLGPSPATAFVLGAVFGAAFAAAGAISSLGVRSSLAPTTRVVLLGWMRGLGTVAGIIASVLALGGLVALVTGRGPGLSLFALGGYLLGANAVAAGIVGVHGVPMDVALDAGPFTGWERMDLLHFGVSGSASPKVLLLAVVVPILGGIVAGRFCRRRSELSAAAIAVRIGGLWGLTLAVLAMLLRVRVLSTFSVGAVDLGGGSAAFDPLVALVVGAMWGTATSFVGARVPAAVRSRALAGVRSSLGSLAAETQMWSCLRCRMPNTSDDRFCVSCGSPREG